MSFPTPVPRSEHSPSLQDRHYATSSTYSDSAAHGSALTQIREDAPALQTGINPDELLDQPGLEARLQTLLEHAKTDSVRATLALLQLKNFYEIRTWVGKAEASLLLADITHVLCKALPPTVTLARCDNYEFALLLSNECSSNAREITRRVQVALLNAVSSTIPPQLQMQCAVGLARVEAGVQSAEVLLARARHKLCHDEDPDGFSSLDNKAFARLIPTALRKRQLQLNLQAVLRFKQPNKACFEVRSALASEAMTIPGQQLFEAAVWNALGEVLDRAVIVRCKSLLASADLSDAQVIINLSLNSIVSNKFMPWLADYLAAQPQLRKRLLLQISELDLLVAQHHLTVFSDALRALDIPLCITHFGSTRDPLRYLHLLQVAMVKLDKSLLNKLKAESLQLDSLRELIEQLHSKGIRVAAGMIERAAQLPLLWQIGVDAAQGNCIAQCSNRPHFPAVAHLKLSADEFTN